MRRGPRSVSFCFAPGPACPPLRVHRLSLPSGKRLRFVLYFIQMRLFCLRYATMARERPVPLPKHARLLQALGENLRLARKRRKLTTIQVAERAGISRSTLYHLEKGDANTSIGSLLQVLVALRLEDDLGQVGADDLLGRKLMDAGLEKPRVPRKKPRRRAEP